MEYSVHFKCSVDLVNSGFFGVSIHSRRDSSTSSPIDWFVEAESWKIDACCCQLLPPFFCFWVPLS